MGESCAVVSILVVSAWKVAVPMVALVEAWEMVMCGLWSWRFRAKSVVLSCAASTIRIGLVCRFS
jgi:hypothetical protein